MHARIEDRSGAGGPVSLYRLTIPHPSDMKTTLEPQSSLFVSTSRSRLLRFRSQSELLVLYAHMKCSLQTDYYLFVPTSPICKLICLLCLIWTSSQALSDEVDAGAVGGDNTEVASSVCGVSDETETAYGMHVSRRYGDGGLEVGERVELRVSDIDIKVVD
ncbi:hypothetical protein EI94DRAFT_797263 [Lactarius quietus]|nr:hypothetical protein EI94DRAFT_797263 [Lactarius quietus]